MRPTRELSPHLDDEAALALVGLPEPVPLRPPALAASLRVAFFPRAQASPRVADFARRLEAALRRCGAAVLPFDQHPSGTPEARLVLITPGEAAAGDMMLDHVTSLRHTTMMTLIDGPCPADAETDLQRRLDAIVRALAWHGAQNVAYIEDHRWTFCTMNGALVRFAMGGDLDQQVMAVLVPKLAAPVVPPHAADFELREGALDLDDPGVAEAAADFGASAEAWARTGLMLFHTPVASLEFKNRFYKRIVSAYLDHRTGMSYGFLARQLPTAAPPALRLDEAACLLGAREVTAGPILHIEGRRWVRLDLMGERLIVPVPDVRVLTTRSGCDKSRLDLRRDLVVLGLSEGRAFLETPPGAGADFKPSYDTRTILANAAANAITASALARLAPGAPWVEAITGHGAAQAHWHGLLDQDGLPDGYVVHGAENPPVSCSTAQSALFALRGKLEALDRTLTRGLPLLGDVHVEPYHGVNVTGPSLTALARLVLKQQARHRVTRFEAHDR